MSLKQNLLRITRNILDRHHRFVKRKFEQSNRALLRAFALEEDPIDEAPQITNRITDDRWKQLQPVWVLSTGRTGTNTLTRLLNLAPGIDAFHEPSPELFQFSFDYYNGSIGREQALGTTIYLRDELVFRSIRDGFSYVETNNRLSYIADLLLELYPASKFIHIYRNPYDFIRSGMRRRYYCGHMRDYARITPLSGDPLHEQWGELTNLEKVAWNWQKINHHCLTFMEQLPSEQKMNFSSEAFFQAKPELIAELFNFVESVPYHPPASDIKSVMGKKHNAQEEGTFSVPENWTSSQIKKVNAIIAPVARTLSYDLRSS
ncbi:sulfotransferase [Fodinibius sediminis]|uniref:Sulfotransferase family protein n=1 Tax=Fodinibius sediminis TaxID=1214077 RepID=A0A521D8M4_9BACT|nr:sulfotransferase [Fodinibius sediminis]SMO68043.1 Sulfotransferase family protein [Fodinibius sediminis]